MSVKDKKRGRPKGTSTQLSAQSILVMAKQMMRDNGKIPSIRQLAMNLNVDAMAIYHYFSNKNALLEAITTSLIQDIYQPITELDKVMNDQQGCHYWKNELHQLCLSYLTLLDNYPGLLETLLGMESVSPAEVFIERFNRVIAPLHLDDDAAKQALDLLVDYLHGLALALNCRDDPSVTVDDLLKGPLELYSLALMHAKKATC
ncbi:TetR/AcrR family transcriptional regulator [Photobacterium nomapromontoriensis]|uniref:TetR/AcrR family transcriptional regulator n=1 Tax=Photobacterium nomapromontoriensis TaxID=2910237 RepID=UPI003D0BBE45